MMVDDEAGGFIEELLDRARRVGDDDSDERWEPIRRLHSRGDRETFDAAARLCRSAEPNERVLGTDILGQLGVGNRPFLEDTLPILVELAAHETSLDVLYSALCSLGHLDDSRALGPLLAHSHHPDRDIRFAVAVSLPSALVNDEQPIGISALLELMEDEDADVRDWATMGLGSCLEADSAEIREALLRRLDDMEAGTAGEALVGLARRHDLRAVEAISAALASGDVGNLIVEAAAELGDPRLLPALQALADRGWAEHDPRGGLLPRAIARCSRAQGS